MAVTQIQAQSLHAINYTVKDGLPSNEVYWMLQAKNGLIWIACDAGLVSFDGVNFKDYPALNSRGRAVSNIREDEKGKIWCHNFAGQIFFLQNDSLRLLKAWEEHFSPIRIMGMQVDTNKLYIESNGRSWTYHISKNEISEKQKHLEVVLDTFHTLRFTWNDIGFQMVMPKREQAIVCPECFYEEMPNVRKNYEGGNWSIKEDLVLFYVSKYDRINLQNSKEKLGVNTKVPFVFKLEKDTFKALHFPEPLAKYRTNIELVKLKVINDSLVWLATNLGLFQWNLENNQIQHYFKGIIISDVVLDREDNLWVSTVEKGIYLVPSLKPRLYDFITKGKNIYHIAKDKHNNLLVGYGDGSIVYWDIKNKKALFSHQFPIKKNIACISYNWETDIFWVASQKKIYTFDTKSSTIKKTKIGGAIKDIQLDEAGNILVAFGHTAAVYSNKLTINSRPNLPEIGRSCDLSPLI